MRKMTKRAAWFAACSTLAIGLGAPAMAQDGGDEEIIVTATRRAADVQDVPYNISAVGAAEIERLGLEDVASLARVVPGLAVIDAGPRNIGSTILRGISVDPLRTPDTNDNGTVATYINETPILIQPRLIDVQRVEVLRGPQGTLYGSGSLGGAIRYIVNDPVMNTFSGDASAGFYQISEADNLSYETQGHLNIPLVDDHLAARIALAYVDDSGFTDYPLIRTGAQSDVDEEQRVTGRASLTWAPDDLFKATLSYYLEESDSGGRTGANPFLAGDYALALRFEEPLERRDNITALEMTLDIGFADIVSSTSKVSQTLSGQRDQTDLLIGFGYGYELYPDFRSFTREDEDFEAFVQELRIVSDLDGPVNYVAGVYYTDEDLYGTSKEFVPGYPQFISVLRPDNLEYFSTDDTQNEEVAIFGELTYYLTDAWQVTGGARWFNLTQDTESCIAFPLFDDPNTTDISFGCRSGTTDINDTIFKFNTSYAFDADKMAYFTFSQGFRRGGANNVPVGGQVNILPDELAFEPDTVDNYEIGLRSEWFDGRLLANVAVYNIDWSDIQVAARTATGSIPITANAGTARSQGVELETRFHATDRLTLGGSYAYVKAELTEDFTSSGDVYRDGTRLPGTPEHQLIVAADYLVPTETLLGDVNFHADVSYRSDITTYADVTNPDFTTLDGYTVINTAVSFEREDGWRGRLYVNNLADEYAYIGQRGPEAYGQQGRFYLINRPRTIGVSIGKSF
ncbi:MAG: TonB-dependent receptor [Hyphomonadaceae bacterium]|nr:TonB-dependent receptor [Hyphomonadaceae bacterium]